MIEALLVEVSEIKLTSIRGIRIINKVEINREEFEQRRLK